MCFAFEFHIDAVKMLINILLKNLSKDFECKIVSDEDFYKWHGYSKKLLGLVKCVRV
jgi:hypothetical protein